MSHLFVGLRHFGLGVVPILVDLVDGGVDLLAEFLSTHETNKRLVNVSSARKSVKSEISRRDLTNFSTEAAVRHNK